MPIPLITFFYTLVPRNFHVTNLIYDLTCQKKMLMPKSKLTPLSVATAKKNLVAHSKALKIHSRPPLGARLKWLHNRKKTLLCNWEGHGEECWVFELLCDLMDKELRWQGKKALNDKSTSHRKRSQGDCALNELQGKKEAKKIHVHDRMKAHLTVVVWNSRRVLRQITHKKKRDSKFKLNKYITRRRQSESVMMTKPMMKRV